MSFRVMKGVNIVYAKYLAQVPVNMLNECLVSNSPFYFYLYGNSCGYSWQKWLAVHPRFIHYEE